MKYWLTIMILGSALATHARADETLVITFETKVAVETAPELPAAIDRLALQVMAALPKKVVSKIVISPFMNLGPTSREKKMGEVVSELLVTRLSGKPNLVIIERAQLDAILQELKLSMLGLTDAGNAEKVGKLLGAEAMIVGSVAEVGDKFAITARYVSVATGQIVFAKEVQVPQAGMIALSSKYVVTKSKSDALFRSLLVPGWGQIYNGQDAKGYVFTGLTLGLAGAGTYLYMHAQTVYDDEYLKSQTPAKAAAAYSKANGLRQDSSMLFIIAGGVWAVNAIDAVWNGTSSSIVKMETETAAASLHPVIAQSANGTRTAMLEMKF